ncbi:hypothetical protein AbaMCR54_00900 [Acinetobacter baumannii]|uniref:hypothetical protein n=1 Tax=Acinetobacter baumannii TaxID=470 RepID=UPI000CE41E64|nr:hypothetical protein [Acinetobacter baumannii]PPC43741.1 hypothetical protein AbaMCR54_00900 [Acinetobacter baumannii]PPC51367.1 hypothetical protein AbaHEU2_15105 [Acinetobacter baumannii]
MSEFEILESAPKDATHYFLVPNGSGEPYYALEKEKKFYWFHGQDEITKPHILSWIKSIKSLKEVKAESKEG